MKLQRLITFFTRTFLVLVFIIGIFIVNANISSGVASAEVVPIPDSDSNVIVRCFDVDQYQAQLAPIIVQYKHYLQESTPAGLSAYGLDQWQKMRAFWQNRLAAYQKASELDLAYYANNNCKQWYGDLFPPEVNPVFDYFVPQNWYSNYVAPRLEPYIPYTGSDWYPGKPVVNPLPPLPEGSGGSGTGGSSGTGGTGSSGADNGTGGSGSSTSSNPPPGAS